MEITSIWVFGMCLAGLFVALWVAIKKRERSFWLLSAAFACFLAKIGGMIFAQSILRNPTPTIPWINANLSYLVYRFLGHVQGVGFLLLLIFVVLLARKRIGILRITEATYVKDYVIHIRFSDGVQGDVNLADELDSEVFEPLKSLSYFQNFVVHPALHTLTWPNGAEFAPEFLYKKIQASA